MLFEASNPQQQNNLSTCKEKFANKNYVRSNFFFTIVLAFALIANTNVSSWSQGSNGELEQYSRESMQQALQTKERYDIHGIHFDIDKSTFQPASNPLLDDLAVALNNFPDWGLRIVGHTDASGSPEANERLSLERANAIKAALVQRGIVNRTEFSGGRFV